ncbi:hypothetical protein [uncultured Hyphomonas sp.]|jgi:hypothetical protein|uniref:hypothetical protein n=1 Tax=uncultured Hyphomonas sp. TaxID=225298 RepID=UPI0030D8993F|tara:strand:- start:111 stop:542 length:432 start_codon:yes stop_codon:yes gene_type:complete
MTKDEFFTLEHTLCHAKITHAIDHLIKIELYTLVGLGAVYAWYPNFSKSAEPVGIPVWFILWIPVVFSLIAVIRSTMQLKYIKVISDYLVELESKFRPEDYAEGWETWFGEHRPSGWNSVYRIALWMTLTAGTLVVALIGTFC